jgi:adenylate kinase family enzyme
MRSTLNAIMQSDGHPRRTFLAPSRNQRERLEHAPMQACQLKDARRVLVTGNAGAGKTRVAQLLAAHLAMPYIGLDLIVWKPGWVSTSKAERSQHESAVARAPSWVVDGVSPIILDAADVVVFLDYPRPVCLWRALKRNVPYLFRSRPGLPANCPEILILPTLLKIIWRFPSRLRPLIFSACAHGKKPLIHVRSNKELARLLMSLGAAESW